MTVRNRRLSQFRRLFRRIILGILYESGEQGSRELLKVVQVPSVVTEPWTTWKRKVIEEYGKKSSEQCGDLGRRQSCRFQGSLGFDEFEEGNPHRDREDIPDLFPLFSS